MQLLDRMFNLGVEYAWCDRSPVLSKHRVTVAKVGEKKGNRVRFLTHTRVGRDCYRERYHARVPGVEVAGKSVPAIYAKKSRRLKGVIPRREYAAAVLGWV